MAKARFEIIPSTLFSASNVSGQFPLNFQTVLAVLVDVTAISGAGATIHLWLQGSDDGGTTWADVTCNTSIVTAAAGTNVAATVNKRNINGDTGITAVPAQVVGIYDPFPFDMLRLRWAITGTTPNVTFSCSAVGK